MPSQVPALRLILNQQLQGSTQASMSGVTSESNQIDFLCEIIRGYEHGDYTRSEVLTIFQRYPVPGFDVLLWIQSKVAEGVYGEETQPDE